MGQDDAVETSGFSAERTKAFVDAVVAIAMTLLILPLMDSVGDSADADHTTAQWLAEHGGQLQSFVLSFVLIAMFWMLHHRQFTPVTWISPALMWITMAWMLTIVWMPVVTALTGQVPDDALQKLLYIGTLMLTSAVMLGTRVYLLRHPALHRMPVTDLRAGMAIDISMIVLFGVALGLSVVFPVLGYYPLFVMLLTGPAQAVISRVMR